MVLAPRQAAAARERRFSRRHCVRDMLAERGRRRKPPRGVARSAPAAPRAVRRPGRGPRRARQLRRRIDLPAAAQAARGLGDRVLLRVDVADLAEIRQRSAGSSAAISLRTRNAGVSA